MYNFALLKPGAEQQSRTISQDTVQNGSCVLQIVLQFLHVYVVTVTV